MSPDALATSLVVPFVGGGSRSLIAAEMVAVGSDVADA
jgi:hypothetical protein